MKKAATLIILSLFSLQGCMVFPLEKADLDQSLYWCPPLLNCASTESVTFVHSIEPFELLMSLDDAWPLIRESIIELGNTNIEHEFSGYIYAKSYTPVFHFLDYFEVLAVPDENRLNVRSSSLLGLTDFFMNYFRTSRFRESLREKGVIGSN
tara:strand:- start:19832 stop:20287 length:456 start_codon:yes stop_codon:yes gene_type:complete